MGFEELTLFVEEEFVEHRFEFAFIGKTEVGPKCSEVSRECGLPSSLSNFHLARSNLPRVAHVRIV